MENGPVMVDSGTLEQVRFYWKNIKKYTYNISPFSGVDFTEANKMEPRAGSVHLA